MTIERAFKLILMLVHPTTVKDIAEEFGCTRKAAYRYLEAAQGAFDGTLKRETAPSEGPGRPKYVYHFKIV